jgi:hypothetical protein
MQLFNDALVHQPIESAFDQGIKPIKGIELDSEAQRFEQTFRLNGIEAIDNLSPENYISNFDSAFFEKLGEIRNSIDVKLQEMQQIFNGAETLTQQELLRAQYQVGMFTVEVTVISNGADKVSNGITTLFQTK